MAVGRTDMIRYDDLKEIFLKLTYILRGYGLIEYTNQNSEAQNLIRYAYARDSQPFQGLADGCSYVWVNYKEDENSSIVDSAGVYNEIKDKFDFNYSQLRTLSVHWIFYGDSAQDNAYMFRQKLYSNAAKDFLAQYNISLILNIPECVLLFEAVNNQWWPRVEIEVDYYIVTEFDEDVDRLIGAEIYLDTEKKEYVILKDESED